MTTFYDSGIGGLTILREYLELKPNGMTQYYADFDILPLGDKPRPLILEQIKIVAKVVFTNSSLLILACNTASVSTIRELQQVWLPQHFLDRQILSISKPITELLELEYCGLKEQKLIILGTQATTNSGFYQKEFEHIGFKKIQVVACPGLCDMIEKLICFKNSNSKFLDQKELDEFFKKINNINPRNNSLEIYLNQLKIPNNSLILLACTHYPIIKNIILKVYPTCKIIDPSYFIAKRIVDYETRHIRASPTVH